LARTRQGGRAASVDQSPHSAEVFTDADLYRVTGSVIADPAPATFQIVVAVSFEPAAPGPLPEAVRVAFGLTRREAMVAELLARGLTNAQLAKALGVTEKTADTHTSNVLRKLGVHSRAAVASTLRRGKPPGPGERSGIPRMRR
jgi:DNA-binding CsgD family transcriptional regulator